MVVNLSDQDSQGQVRFPWDELSGHSWELCDLLTGAVYMREGRELQATGLYVDLEPWKFHLFAIRKA